MAGKSLLDLVIENPNGLGENPPAAAPKVFFDEYGQPYDETGNRIEAKTQDPSLGESLLNIAESPAKMLVGAVTEPVNALQRLAENSVDESGNIAIPNPENPQNQQDVLTGLLSLYGGNAMNPAAVIPKGSLASNAFKAAERLPMDEASRLARARELGFDTESTAYRGLTRPFDEGDTGYYQMFTSDPVEASEYAMKNPLASPNVVPAYLRMGKTLEVDAGGSNFNRIFTGGIPQEVRLNGLDSIASMDELAHAARNSGYDSLRVRNVFDNVTNEKPSFTGAPAKSNPGMTDDELLAELGLEPLPPSTPSSDSSGFRDLEMSHRRPVTVSTIFDPVRIRSKFAAFNPADIDKAGLLLSDTGKPSLMGSAIAGAESNTPIQGFRGSNQARPVDAPRSRYWASTSPEVASGYATSSYGFDAPNVTPANFSFENPMTVDAGGSYWAQIPHNGSTTTTDNLARIAEANGHDGLIVRNVIDEMAGNDLPADSILALKRGTVTSPTTGEVLFSDTGQPSIIGSALAGAEANQPVRAFHSTDAQFDRFDPVFTDEVGFHFGNKDQAQTRQMVKGGITSFINPWSDWRTIPVDIETQNPAALSRDVQHFTGARVAGQLVRDGIAPPSLLDDIAGASPEQQTKYVRDWLVSNGYDSVRYPNDFEGAGAPSYMALGTGNVKHAKTGDVLFAGAPPVVTTSDNQDQPLSLADLALTAGNR